MSFRFRLAASTLAISVAGSAAPAWAQSTGSIDFEQDAIVVTGTRTDQPVDGIIAPDSTKAKAVITQELIQRQTPGQTILDTINEVPGVSFQNNDAYGSSGGTLTIRGFSGDQISLTFDGIPLNDSGNYAIYSNQQLDPELIEQVNVNLGSTDVDSPTPSAVGGTVNYRTIIPARDFGAYLSGSAGEYDFMRIFGKIETGEFGPFGTRAFVAASRATNRVPYNGYGRINKQQYNARIFQELSGDDFISIAGNYNENRNNFFGSLPLRLDPNRVPGSGSGNRFPITRDERFYTINYPCTIAPGVRGRADTTSSCGTEFDRRYNPSNTGSIRGSSRFTFGKATLTVDPFYEYVKANGGGTATGYEYGYDVNPASGRANCSTAAAGSPTANCQFGYFGGRAYTGVDLNGDGDLLDTVTVLAPSQTQTHRIGVIASLRFDINPANSVRIAYTYDRARHRQTGQVGLLQSNGEPYDVFPVNDPIIAPNGTALQKRDRLSYAILHQVSGEYRGEFGPLRINAGVRAPFFRRNLNNYCYTTSASGFVDCSGQNTAVNAAYAQYSTAQGPQQRIFDYNRVLPNIGFLYRFTPSLQAFGSYAKGLRVPGTDSLYNAFYFATTVPEARPAPETSDSFDLGLRYRSRQIQAQVSGYYIKYHNRLASAYDPVLDATVYRNLGDVDKYGLDGYIAYQPVQNLFFYLFGGVNRSEIKNDVQTGANTFAPTAGRRESGAPEYTYGARVRGSAGPFELGVSAKRTGPRYIYDTNLPVFSTTPTYPVPAGLTQVYPAQAPAYWLVNLDARFRLSALGMNDKSYFQLNVYNLTDEFYVGGFGGGLSQTGSPPFVQIGAPRTVSGTLVFAF